ncbi:unnamed protein product [Microthlaspi erraticum]|uniref:Pentacotripeptide-repeat region of PRORP domain-containing protein n=1 Tax=Microthlaspi erraticum TaxID=1685480 RepID=A0A6D2HI84_9BRAS|nr:unnamed protein product [Microthlaspi erraticum]
MRHLLRPQSQIGVLFRILPCRSSFLHLSKTIPSPDLTHDTLRRRIERLPVSTASVTPLLREWCDRRNRPAHAELRSIITSLHKSNRFSHALQISEWMSDEKAYNLSPADFEIRLLLIAKIRGLEEADKFLDTIPVKKRDFYVHSALLNCCNSSSSLSIAETTFQRMKELGFAANSSDPYNTMLSLYLEAEDHDMVVKLLREMDRHNMVPQGVAFATLLPSFAIGSVPDSEGMHIFLNKWGKKIKPWATCFYPACLQLRVGSRVRGLDLLRRTEYLLDDGSRARMYGLLMKLYCNEGETEDVYRLWNLAKERGISFDSSTRSEMIKAFTSKGHLDRAHEVLQELDTGATDLGLQRRHLKEAAEKLVDMLGKKESKWGSLTHKLQKLVEDEDDKEEQRRKRVAEAMEGRLNNRWNPKGCLALSAYACAQYVEGRRDIESAANILRLLSKEEQVSYVMDKRRLSLKMVEAMRGGGYVGGGQD